MYSIHLSYGRVPPIISFGGAGGIRTHEWRFCRPLPWATWVPRRTFKYSEKTLRVSGRPRAATSHSKHQFEPILNSAAMLLIFPTPQSRLRGVFHSLQLFPRLEPHRLARRYVHFFARPWIAPDPCLSRLYAKNSESPQLYALPSP